jgi:hypothetical protein
LQPADAEGWNTTTPASAQIIFGAQIQQMKGVRYMFIFFQYAFLGIIGLSAIYFALCPKDLSKEHEIEDVRDGGGFLFASGGGGGRKNFNKKN